MTNLENQLRISVAICTYNGAMRLPEVLEALALQEGIVQEEWEILLIDNASTDGTKQVFAKFAEHHPNLLCRYVYEPKPGTGFARICAFHEAAGEWICFVDDDNILEIHYLSRALRYTSTNSRMGAFGGRSIARLESFPPEWFDAVKNGLAIWDGGDEARQMNIGERCFTAGLVVSTELARQVVTEPWIMTGRTKNFPIAGEDLELCLKISRLGWEIWYVPDLLFEHLIPENRLTIKYLKNIFATFGATHLLLFPVYFPIKYGKYITMIKIIGTALIKWPWYFMLSLLPISNRWQQATRAWTYYGVFKYWHYAYKRLGEI